MKTTSIICSFLSSLAAVSAHGHHHGHSSHGSGPTHRLLMTPAFQKEDTAVVVIDPQNDFLSPNGVTWEVVGESVTEHNTVEHIKMLFQAADDKGFLVFISPHYYYPHDKKWHFEGAIEKLMHSIEMFDRVGPLSLENFEGSGADWLDEYKPYIEGKENVIVTSPHKVYGPEANDLVLQLRKRGIDRIILAGMSANLCVESHLRELLEQGFEVYVIKDATAGAKTDYGDGYEAALINFNYLSNGVLSTADTVAAMGADPTEVALAMEERREEAVNGDHDSGTNGSDLASTTTGMLLAVMAVFVAVLNSV